MNLQFLHKVGSPLQRKKDLLTSGGMQIENYYHCFSHITTLHLYQLSGNHSLAMSYLMSELGPDEVERFLNPRLSCQMNTISAGFWVISH